MKHENLLVIYYFRPSEHPLPVREITQYRKGTETVRKSLGCPLGVKGDPYNIIVEELDV